MKKFLVGMLAVLFVFGLAGCVDMGDDTDTTGGEMDLPTELPEDQITITFWHIYGEAKAALLASQIEDFEAMYPNVTVEATSQSDYDTLREKINMGVSVDQVPSMAVGYPDHFAGYVIADAAVALDQYIDSDITYEVTNSSSSIFEEDVAVGLDLTDFVQSYLDENNQYEGGYYYSVPYSKSTEMMAYNVDVMKAHVTEIRNAGITVSDNGYLSTEVPLTYDELVALRDIIVDPSGTDSTAMKTEFLMNYDSSSNMFINMSRQWNAGYTNSDGDILIDNDTTRSMLNWIDENFNDNTFVLPVEWDEDYGSTNFKYGDVAMTVGSTAGVAYNIPSEADEQDSLQLGIFDVGFAPTPQPAAEEGDQFTVSIDGTDETFSGSLSAVQQGPNIGIFKDATPEERLYSWLLIKHLISAENTAAWAMQTGYLPARLSGYNSPEYSNFLDVGEEFLDADGEPGWDSTDPKWNDLHASMASLVARAQNEYYQYDPAFAASSTSAGSAKVRVESGYCLENIYINRYDSTEEALNRFINAVIWE